MAFVPRRNASGCPDPTTHDALIHIVEADEELERRTSTLIKTLKIIIDLAGYDLLARIEVRDRKTGRNFR